MPVDRFMRKGMRLIGYPLFCSRGKTFDTIVKTRIRQAEPRSSAAVPLPAEASASRRPWNDVTPSAGGFLSASCFEAEQSFAVQAGKTNRRMVREPVSARRHSVTPARNARCVPNRSLQWTRGEQPENNGVHPATRSMLAVVWQNRRAVRPGAAGRMAVPHVQQEGVFPPVVGQR
jgi:hypothetical protein